jgi:DNA-binding CsgD family transcriptional regulator
VRLRPALKRPEMLIVPELGRLLDEHRQRLRRRQEATRVREETATIRRGIRMYDSLDAALDVLAATGERREKEKALLERIPAVTYIKKAISPPNSNIAGRVACAVRREGLERRDHPNLPLELKHEPRDDFLELVSFLEREDLRRDASQAGLSAQERETFDLLLDGYDNTTISVLLDRSATQVRQEKHRALKKIKAHRRAAGL